MRLSTEGAVVGEEEVEELAGEGSGEGGAGWEEGQDVGPDLRWEVWGRGGVPEVAKVCQERG